MKNFSMVELFSRIGAQAKAFSRVCKRRNVSFKTLKTCEWDIHAITGYYLIHRKSKEIINWSNEKCNKYLSSFNLSNDGKVLANIKTITGLSLPLKRLICTAIKETHNLIDVKSIHAQDIPNNLDVLTYSFPCQDLSNVGGFHRVQRGIDRDANSRSGLLWEVERVLKERKALSMDMPKFLILENVTSLLAKRHRHNFEDWKEQLRKLGYYNKVYKLNSLNLGVPQHRQRLLMLSIFTNNNSELENKIEDYLNKNNLEQVRIKMTPLSSILKLDYSNSKYFNEANYLSQIQRHLVTLFGIII